MMDGEKSVTEVELPPEYKYNDIMESIKTKNKAEGKRHLFKDKQFPPDKSSLSHEEGESKYDCITAWKRPHELSENPEFESIYPMKTIYLKQIDSFRVWWTWTAAVAALSTNQACLVKAIKPAKQTMEGENYVGMFQFRFWTLGSWTDVIIDDYLPVIENEFAFMKFDKKDPYWMPLMHKAYAKHCGSYQAAEGAHIYEFFEDFTGGLAITYNLKPNTGNDVFRILEKASKNHSLICCTKRLPHDYSNLWLENIGQFGYHLRRAMKVEHKGETVRLLELVTPHQREPDWTGDWSVGSKVFKEAQHLHNTMGYMEMYDGRLVTQLCGVFFINFEDFKNYFSDVTILATGQNFQEEAESNFYGGQDNWLHHDVKGTWKTGSVVDIFDEDGDTEEEKVFAENPQYYMNLEKSDDFNPYSDDPDFESKCFLMMELMQKDIWRTAAAQLTIDDEPYLLFIALHIFKVKEKPKKKLSADFFYNNKPVAESGTHCDGRQVSIAKDFDLGHYVVVPSVWEDPNEDSPYLLRVYAESDIKLELL